MSTTLPSSTQGGLGGASPMGGGYQTGVTDSLGNMRQSPLGGGMGGLSGLAKPDFLGSTGGWQGFKNQFGGGGSQGWQDYKRGQQAAGTFNRTRNMVRGGADQGPYTGGL
jgi:hypothetical protein